MSENNHSDEEYLTKFISYFSNHYYNDIEQILYELDESIHYGFPVDATLWANQDPEIVYQVLMNHSTLLPLLDDAVWNIQNQIKETHVEKERMIEKRHVHVRLWRLPGGYGYFRVLNISSIRSSDTGRFISLTGTVIRTTVVKMLELEREYECNNCGHRFRVFADIDQNAEMIIPKKCPSQEVTRKGRKKCDSASRRLIEESRVVRDYQEITVQERLQHLSVGSIPRSILVVLQDDLVDIAKAGDDIILTGVVRTKWEPLKNDQRCIVSTYILANHLRVINDDKSSIRVTPELKRKFENFWLKYKDEPLKARNIIVQNICPQLYGLHLVKLSLLVTMIGGINKIQSNGFRIRGQSHLLIVGDPGTGKSQLLKWAAKAASRSVFTTGIGTTRAGLTCSAVRDQGEWMLEAGALVLADGGVCCIDEFGCIRENDRATIHEAMEQQTLSIAKAGLVTTLNTRCTVIGVLNPKGTFDHEADLSVNTAIASPLLSRFDIILLMLDHQKEEWDKKVSTHIMKSLGQPQLDENDVEYNNEEEQLAKGEFMNTDFKNDSLNNINDPDHDDTANDKIHLLEIKEDEQWSIEQMQAYIHYVRTNFEPDMTNAANKVLSKYYQAQRAKEDRNASRTTVRMLESLVRLAQGHARLMFRTQVLPQDAIAAIILSETSMTTSTFVGMTTSFHGEFPSNPDKHYIDDEATILGRLGVDSNFFDANERKYDYNFHLKANNNSNNNLTQTSDSSQSHQPQQQQPLKQLSSNDNQQSQNQAHSQNYSPVILSISDSHSTRNISKEKEKVDEVEIFSSQISKSSVETSFVNDSQPDAILTNVSSKTNNNKPAKRRRVVL